MVMRIDKSTNREFLVFTLSGRIEKENIRQLKQIFAITKAPPRIAFNLEDVKIVDQPSVEFLEGCETSGTELWNCPPYLREWIERVRTRK
jgi:hypothetical protein